jgi:beta-ribofuranosylaminobenzene 5'-phosphate synthase
MKIRSYPRLHITLADLAGVTLRCFGGAGVAIDGLPTIIDVRRGRGSPLRLPPAFDEATSAQIRAIIDRVRPLCGSITVTVHSAPPQHVGLGSKTSLAMAVVAGAFGAAGRDGTREELQRLSGRGGASGVGIHTFFDGGLVIDGGHPQQPKGTRFGPSSSRSGHVPPPSLVRLPVPSSWRFTLFLPRRGHRYSGREEQRFFACQTPISPTAALRTIALMYHGIATAIASADIRLFAEALARIHRTGFKQREVYGQPPPVRRLLRALQKRSFAAGMSSMGPLVYAVTDDTMTRHAAETVALEFDATLLGTFVARNTGYEVVDG